MLDLMLLVSTLISFHSLISRHLALVAQGIFTVIFLNSRLGLILIINNFSLEYSLTTILFPFIYLQWILNGLENTIQCSSLGIYIVLILLNADMDWYGIDSRMS